MKNNYVKAFWIGFLFTTALTAVVYWLWRQKRIIAPDPLVVSRQRLPVQAPKEKPPSKATQEIQVSDPLEEIKGIGPVSANRLNEAGILTFEQLAASSTDELAHITGATRWDPADWIAEASELAALK